MTKNEAAVMPLAFVGIVLIASVIFYLCIRRSIAKNHESLIPLGGRMKPVMLEKIDVEIINEILIMYTSERLKIITDNFKQRLGEGGFGVVYKGVLEDGVPVAVKVLNCTLSDQTIKQQFKAEVNSIRRTRHPNLVRLYGFCSSEGLKALVYEFMENGSLNTLLFDSKKKNKIGFQQLLNIAVGTAKGIAYLHEDCRNKIIHYDIKPENILLDRNLSPKVSDFGMAKLCSRNVTHFPASGFKGTPGYAAPEMWFPFPITHKCDVYSFGMLLFEILGRRRNMNSDACNSQEWLPRYVWNKFNEGDMKELMVTLGINEKYEDAATKMAMVALWCVQHQPEVRPLMSSVVKMLEGVLNVDQPVYPFSHSLFPTCWSKLENISRNASSASSGSSIWITPFSREEYLFLR